MNGDWLYATLHRAWCLHAAPNGAAKYKYFHDTYAKLVEGNDVRIDLGQYPIIAHSLELPPGNEISQHDAVAANSNIWNAFCIVRGSVPSETDLRLMRLICDTYPSFSFLNTLAALEYRAGNFVEAIKSAKQSILAWQQQFAWAAGHIGNPIDFAILSMSYFQLGDLEKANEYREKLTQARQQYRQELDYDFDAEVKELFESRQE